MRTPRTICCSITSVTFAVAILAVHEGKADPVGDSVAKSIVSIEVKGRLANGDPCDDQATGFLISTDGYIATSNHVFKCVSQPTSVPEDVKIFVSVGEKKAVRDRTAYLVDYSENFDTALLKTPATAGGYPFLKLGTSDSIQLNETVVSFSGFPNDAQGLPQATSTKVVARDAPGGHTWIVSGQIDPGYSGSPLYDLDGAVLGIIKGSIGARTAFVPIDLVDQILSHIKFRDLERRLNELTSSDNFTRKVDEEDEKFLTGDRGKGLLTAWLKGYLAGQGNVDISNYLNKNKARVEEEIDGYMEHVVAYSYNETFQLDTEKGPKSHEIPFYKANGDLGILSCDAKYPSSAATYPNKILYSFNDDPTMRQFGLIATRADNRVRKFDTIAKDNASLHDPTRPSSTLSAFQSVNFAIQDAPPIKEGPVTIQCTILIIGAARYDAAGHH
jgi:hypothetical protein